ncbi:hypothetical protein DQ04_02181030 [Trypanosoma grayi]|uniref:hypothetical protein n=1 Tax=Trypanosoma grayi TaxID=71804 RepID=UPI0004F47803|nr:hypothetical protein DQ04_02181030 [Trypanosoma grayi]KEG11887.1 hypothetical protein DQ04_02181030 [Trypanosoma grayi]
MYASHKKDINRHKSFHPLTYRNLRKVEQRQEDEEAQKKADAERDVQLRHDQEQRRYDDLVLAASADGVSGQLAKFRQVENIFAAEAKVAGGKHAGTAAASAAIDTPPLLQRGTLAFKKEEKEADEKNVRKRTREDDEARSNSKKNSDGKGEVVTGYMSTSDAAKLRKELDTLQKARHDPLRRIERFQNRTVAAEAKRRALETTSTTTTCEGAEKNTIRSRIQELLEMKKRK